MKALPSHKLLTSPLPKLSLTCFGRFESKRAGQPLTLCSNRNAQVIFRYLVAQPHHSAQAEKLVAVVWPEDEPEIARNKLHIAISALRRSLHAGLPQVKGQGYLVCHNHVYSLNPLAPIHTDVEEFQLFYQMGQQHPEERIVFFEKACQLYTGPFLSEDLYADWSFLLREQFNQMYLTMCRTLTEHYFQARGYEEAARWATLILAQDRCDEAAHRQLMEIYAAQGIRSKAIQQYHYCAQILYRELGIQPLQITTQLFQMLVDGKLLLSEERFCSMTLTPKERYLMIVDELHANLAVSQSKKSLSSGLRVNNKVFAMLSKGRMVVKLPQERVDELINRGEGERYESGGHPLREWVLIEPASEEGWVELVQEALTFVKSLP